MLEQAIEQLTSEIKKLREVMERQPKAPTVEPRHPTPVASPPAPPREAAAFIGENRVAELIGISVATVRRWRMLRTGPPFRKIGSAVRYSRAELEAWLEIQRPQ